MDIRFAPIPVYGERRAAIFLRSVTRSVQRRRATSRVTSTTTRARSPKLASRHRCLPRSVLRRSLPRPPPRTLAKSQQWAHAAAGAAASVAPLTPPPMLARSSSSIDPRIRRTRSSWPAEGEGRTLGTAHAKSSIDFIASMLERRFWIPLDERDPIVATTRWRRDTWARCFSCRWALFATCAMKY